MKICAHTERSQTTVQAWTIIRKHKTRRISTAIKRTAHAQFEPRNRLLTEERTFTCLTSTEKSMIVIHTFDNQFVICSYPALFITFYFKSLAHFHCILLVNKLRTDESWKVCLSFASDYCEACTAIKCMGRLQFPPKLMSSTKTNWTLLKCMNRPMTFKAEIKTNWKRYDFIDRNFLKLINNRSSLNKENLDHDVFWS